MDSGNNFAFGIRLCTLSEISNVMAINEATLPENYPMFFYEQILERYSDSFFLAYLENDPETLIGYIMWRIERGPSSFGLSYVKKGHLVSLAVLKQFRRLGVASELLRKSMQAVEEYSVSEFVLEVRASNTGAIRLYEQTHKFQKIRIVGNYYKDGEDAFYMSLKRVPNNSTNHLNHSMSDVDIIKYYDKKNAKNLCYACPACSKILLKGKKFSFPGSIHPQNPVKIKCAYCDFAFSLYEISMGTYDLD